MIFTEIDKIEFLTVIEFFIKDGLSLITTFPKLLHPMETLPIY